MIEAHRLSVFRAVVTAGSVNGAAATLGYTPSAISQQLAALQRETGLALIERRGRGIVATPAGRRLAEEASGVLERLAELDVVLGDLREGRIGTLTISYIASAGAAWMPAVVAALTADFPDLGLDLRLVELAEPDRAPDLEISVRGAASPITQDYARRLLLDEEYVVALPATHRLAAAPSVGLAELLEDVWVDNDLARGFCRQVMIDACATLGFAPVFRVQAQDYRSALSFVAAGVGITVLPTLGTLGLPDGVTVRQLRAPTPRRQVELRIRPAVREQQAVLRAVALIEQQVRLSSSGGRS